MSDLLLPIMIFPIRIITDLRVGSWIIGGPFGQVLCKLLAFLGNASILVSIQGLVLIAADRFGAVVYPLRSPLISSKLCPVVIFATWIVAIAVLWPFLFAFKVVEYPGKMVCEWKWNESFEESSGVFYFTLGFVLFFYIPVVLLFILYSIILVKLKSRIHSGQHVANAEEHHTKRNRNVLKLAMAVVLGFAVCFLPFTINAMLLHFVWDNGTRFPCGMQRYWIFTTFLFHANCAVNPIICFILGSNYRKGLKRLLNCSVIVQR